MSPMSFISQVRWKLDALACSLQGKSTLPPSIGKGGRLTICFDDFPQSAARVGLEVLEKNGVNGTYFVSMGLECETVKDIRMFDRGDLERVWAAGHEIGCHTHSHIDCRLARSNQLAEETQRNREEIEHTLTNCPLTSFAFPKGRFSWLAKRQLSGKFNALRTTTPGLNYKNADANMLNANPLYDSKMNVQAVERLLQRANNENAWLIFYTHDVQDEPSRFGCRPQLLDFTLKIANQLKMDIRPMRDFT